MELLKGIQPIVHLLFHITTWSVAIYYVGWVFFHIYYFKMKMYTWNFYTLVSSFLPVKVLKWTTVHTNDVVFNLCKKTIILFIMACKFLIHNYIHDDIIKHQTTWHDACTIIITEIYLFHCIHNRENRQGNILWWR